MPRLSSFTSVSVDGYFTGVDGDMSWAYQSPDDAEWNAFVAGNASGGGRLVFGRVTYEMMAGFWPTPMAAARDPVVAERMNAMPKLVFSRTLSRASWANTTLVQGDLIAAVRKLKAEPGADLAILGSGTIVAQLAQQNLIDELQLVVIPIVLGQGRSLFAGVTKQLTLTPTRTRTFANGNILLCYRPRTSA